MSGTANVERCAELRQSKDFFNAAKCFEQCGEFNEAFSCDMEAIKAIPETDFQQRIEVNLHATTLARKMGDQNKEYQGYKEIADVYLSWREATADGNQTGQAIAYLVKAADLAVRMGRIEPAAHDYLNAGEEALTLHDSASALSYSKKAIDVALTVPAPKPAGLLMNAYDQAGYACALVNNSLKPAKVYWDEAKRYADELGTPYSPTLPGRHAQLKLNAKPVALAVIHQDPQAPGSHVSSTITATLTEAMGRVANCVVKFSVLKEFGAVIPATARTNKDGIATTTFFPTGKVGLCTVKGRAKTGAKASADITLVKAPQLDLAEVRWIYPNSLGLYGVKPEAPHWRKGGPRPIAHVFAGRGLDGGTREKKGLEIEITVALAADAGQQSLPKVRITGTAQFKALPGTPTSPLQPLVFIGEASDITTEPKKVSVRSSDKIPDAIGHYDVEIAWSFEHPVSGGTAWAPLGGATKTVNDLYVTWKQPLPSVVAHCRLTGVTTGNWWPELSGHFEYGEPQLEDDGTGKSVARVYLECLRWSTEAILSQGDLNPNYLEKEVKDKECRQEIQILDRIFEYICTPNTFGGRAREPETHLWSAASLDHQALDVINKKSGDCGDWACLFHDLAATQGIHTCLVALGRTAKARGENFCLYPAVAKTSRSMLPLVFDPFITRWALDNDQWKEIPDHYGLCTSRDHQIFNDRGGWLPYQERLIKWYGWKQPVLLEVWNPSTYQCSTCKEKALKYYEAKNSRWIIMCPLCGISIAPD